MGFQAWSWMSRLSISLLSPHFFQVVEKWLGFLRGHSPLNPRFLLFDNVLSSWFKTECCAPVSPIHFIGSPSTFRVTQGPWRRVEPWRSQSSRFSNSKAYGLFLWFSYGTHAPNGSFPCNRYIGSFVMEDGFSFQWGLAYFCPFHKPGVSAISHWDGRNSCGEYHFCQSSGLSILRRSPSCQTHLSFIYHAVTYPQSSLGTDASDGCQGQLCYQNHIIGPISFKKSV